MEQKGREGPKRRRLSKQKPAKPTKDPQPRNLVGPVVRRLRLDVGLSQEALTARLQVAGWDVSRAGLSKVEARLRRVNDAELLVLARVLKCSPQDLYPKRPRDVQEVLWTGRGGEG